MATLRIIADEIGDALDRPFDFMFKERIKSIFRHEAATMIRQSVDKDGLTDHFKTTFSAGLSVVDDSSLPCGTTCGAIRTTNKLANPIRYKTDDPFSYVGNKDGTIVYIYTKRTELPYADLTEVYLAKPRRYVYENGYAYIKMGGVCGSITVVADYSATVAGTILVTSTAHDLVTGDKITISGTTSYNDDFTITKVDADTFYITDIYVASETGDWIRDVTDECLNIEGAFNMGDVFANTKENRLNSNVFTDDTELPLPEDLIQTIKLKLLQGELSITDSDDKIKAQHIDN